jgi:hypothetical protein
LGITVVAGSSVVGIVGFTVRRTDTAMPCRVDPVVALNAVAAVAACAAVAEEQSAVAAPTTGLPRRAVTALAAVAPEQSTVTASAARARGIEAVADKQTARPDQTKERSATRGGHHGRGRR